MSQLRIVTWNVHGAVGLDGRCLPARQLELLRGLDADCVALQEFVDHPAPGGGGLLAHWADSLGLRHSRIGACFHRGGQEFANALLSRHPIEECDEHDMSAPGAYRRAALDVIIAAPEDIRLHAVVVHCAVRSRPRALQWPMLRSLVERSRADVTLLLGDFNEWRAWPTATHEWRAQFACAPQRPTFPAVAPLLPLDRIWVRPAACLVSSYVASGTPAAIASDHRPVVATIRRS